MNIPLTLATWLHVGLRLLADILLLVIAILAMVWFIGAVWLVALDKFIRLFWIHRYIAEFVYNGELARIRKQRREDLLRKAAQ